MTPPRRAGYSASVVEDMAELRRAGLTFGEIAARYGLTPGRVRAWLVEAGHHTPRVRAVVDPADVAARAAAGRSPRQVAEDMGLSVTTVRSKLRDARAVAARHHHPSYSPEQVAAMAAQYRAGVPLRAIAAAVGVATHTARMWISESGEPIRAGSRPRVDVDPAVMIARRRAGQTVKRIAADLGVSTTLVRARLRAAGVDTGRLPRGASVDDRADGIVERWHQQWAIADIARWAGCAPHTVRASLRRRGIDPAARRETAVHEEHPASRGRS